ncbi:MAG: DegQ family serine endoprotease [Deltaproteobacteria bacterium]|nr:DegQ family serine endoprotease [Deltaproteobacteria bacterium]
MQKEDAGRKNFLKFLIVFLAGTFMLSLVGMVNCTPWTKNAAVQEVQAASVGEAGKGYLPSLADLVERLKPAVVNISTTKTVSTGMGSLESPFRGSPFEKFFGDEFFQRFFGEMPREYKQRSLGSGFIISKDGFIFTNNHVVEKADEIVVKLSDGKEYKAEIKGRDKNTDLALLKIKPEGELPVTKLGVSSELRVGDWVVAIGNPFGLSQTVTAGIVSAKGRVIGAGPYDDFIQTDASINPGNSGGPLFNLRGEVVGINTAIVAQGQGIGFAIPIDIAREALTQLRDKGKVIRGWLGVSVQDVTEEMAEKLGLKSAAGALVGEVFKGNPADKAGIKTGDVIIEIDGKGIKDTHELLKIVAGISIGREAKVTVVRDGKEKMIMVKVEERREGEILAQETEGYFGMTVQEITAEIAQHMGLPSTDGVIVSAVEPESPAGDAGIKPRDVILQVDTAKIKNMKDFKKATQSRDAKSVLLLISRGDTKYFVVVRER